MSGCIGGGGVGFKKNRHIPPKKVCIINPRILPEDFALRINPVTLITLFPLTHNSISPLAFPTSLSLTLSATVVLVPALKPNAPRPTEFPYCGLHSENGGTEHCFPFTSKPGMVNGGVYV